MTFGGHGRRGISSDVWFCVRRTLRPCVCFGVFVRFGFRLDSVFQAHDAIRRLRDDSQLHERERSGVPKRYSFQLILWILRWASACVLWATLVLELFATAATFSSGMGIFGGRAENSRDKHSEFNGESFAFNAVRGNRR